MNVLTTLLIAIIIFIAVNIRMYAADSDLSQLYSNIFLQKNVIVATCNIHRNFPNTGVHALSYLTNRATYNQLITIFIMRHGK